MQANEMKALDEQFAEALHLAAHGWRTALDRRLRPLGYSRSRWMVLLHVSRNDGITHRELAERMGIEAPTLVRLIDRMEGEGLLKRCTSETDRRVKHLRLSPPGHKEVVRIRASASDLRQELLSGLSKAEIKATLNVLQHIRSKLENPT
jgi:MarR family transcriptional regulator, transcriptional regulator for hemolysin